MRTALMVLALLAAPAFASQTVWKWVDEKGVTHYSDQPIPGAQKVELSSGTRSNTSNASIPTSSPSRSSSSTPDAIANYRNFEIWKPANQETIANTGGTVDVRLRYEPSLQPGHSVTLYLDGQLVPDFPPAALEYTLKEVPRGMHSLVAVLRDSSNKRIQESPPVQFTVRQQSVAQPPVGPALRNPPKPQRQAGNKLTQSQPSYSTLNGQTTPRINPRTNLPVRP